MRLGYDVAEKPGERAGVVLLRDDADTHRAQLGVELAAIDALLDKCYSRRRTSLLGDSKTRKDDSVVGVGQRAHDGLVAVGGVPQKKSHRLASHQRLLAVEERARQKALRQRADFSEQGEKLTLNDGRRVSDPLHDRLPDLVTEGLKKLVELRPHLRIIEHQRRGKKSRDGAHPDAPHEA